MTARVVCVSYATRQLLLSCTRSAMELQYVPEAVAHGAVHADGVVAAVDGFMGMLVEPNVYVPLVHLGDRHVKSAEELFHAGQTKVTYRVVGYDLLDDLVLVRALWRREG